MRVYEGGPRQDYEEALRSLGTFLDQRGMREILIVETTDGFLVQGLAPPATSTGAWTEETVNLQKETLILADDDVARLMEEAYSQRRNPPAARTTAANGFYEQALRVLGRYIDEQKPRDVFLFEQEHAFVLRLLMGARAGDRHVLAEFTRDDVEQMIAAGPQLRAFAADSAETRS